MRLRSFILPLVLAGGLGSIYFLPLTGAIAQSAINMTLPKTVGDWFLKPIPASPEEIRILDKTTTFAKAHCLCPRLDEFSLSGAMIPDRVDLSVVLSGYDLNNSIHRPERCMPAQGHSNLRSTTIPVELANGRTLTVRRIRSTQTLIHPEDRKLDQHFECVTYYFFVGHDRVEYDHLQRTLTDMKDRVIRGIDQRWAYVTTSMWFGKIPWIEKPVTEAEADSKVLGLLREFAEKQINWDQITR